MAEKSNQKQKKEIVKTIIRELHAGLSADAAAKRILEEAGYLSSAEIATIEEELLAEGISPEEIQKFCNVHALMFEAVVKNPRPPADASHPVELFRTENTRIRELVGRLAALVSGQGTGTPAELPAAVAKTLAAFFTVIDHYIKKEQALFPLLEKRGFSGPSKVMWGKHDQVRDSLKQIKKALPELTGREAFTRLTTELIDPLLTEIESMIEKEELILYPTALEKLTPDDWEEVRNAFHELEQQAVAAESAAVTAVAGTAGAGAAAASRAMADGEITLPSGKLSLTELEKILNALPVDLSFVDVNDQVKYFSEPKERIFPRARSVVGRKVQNCHPPKSVHIVEKIINSFRTGKKDSADFWINLHGKLVLIRYLAVRDDAGVYLGTLEVSQDTTPLRALEGEKRLLDWKD